MKSTTGLAIIVVLAASSISVDAANLRATLSTNNIAHDGNDATPLRSPLRRSRNDDELKSTSKMDNTLSKHLANVNDPLRSRDGETPFFWRIPKTGHTALQNMYWCMGSTIANDEDVDVLLPMFPGKVINVDLSSHEGILAAKERGFLTAQPTFITTQEFKFTAEQLFSEKHKARMFAMFHHPVDLAASRFYDLQKKSNTSSNPWAKKTIVQYAEWSENFAIGNNNLVVRHLVDKTKGEELTPADLEYAKELVTTKFVVGILDQFEESVHRFNVLMGVDEKEENNEACIQEYVTIKDKDDETKEEEDARGKKMDDKWNHSKHPTVKQGSETWELLAEIHSYDVQLYEHLLKVFEDQKTLSSTLLLVDR